jgi:hypothetical protein
MKSYEELNGISELRNNLTNIEFDTFSELRNCIYNAEDMIDGEYTIGMYGDKYKEIDDLHAKLLEILSEYDTVLENILK